MMNKAEEMREISDRVNREYELSCKRFSSGKEIEDFKIFLNDMIRRNAENGCTSFEFETENDLRDTDILEYLKRYGYEVKFYKLDERYSESGYCLLINW